MFTVNREERFLKLEEIPQLKKLWVHELGMSLVSFQQALEKILRFKIRWIGDSDCHWTTYMKVLWKITCCSYETDGEVSAFVLMGDTGRTEKVPFVFSNRPFLAIYDSEFTIIVEYVYLNITELIFWIDNEKCDVTNLGIDVFVGDFL